MERDSSRPRFKLVHVVMPRLWLKQIKNSYRRKRPGRGHGHGDGDGDYTTTSSCDTSFDSSSSCHHLHPHLGPIDSAARSLIDVAFPLSPTAFRRAASAKQFPALAMSSPLRYAVSPSPASASSPSTRFYPSPCRYPPSPTRRPLFPPKAIDIPYPISPRNPPLSLLQSPSPAARFLSVRNLDALMPAPPSPPRFSTASAPDRTDYNKPPPRPVALLRRSRSARSSLFACFSDDFRLPESAATAPPACLSRLGSTRGDCPRHLVPLSPSGHGAEEEEQQQGGTGARITCCASTPGCSEYCAACSGRSRETVAASCSSWRSSSGNYGGSPLSKSARHSSSISSSKEERPGTSRSTHHRRGLSLSCMSSATRNSSPDGQQLPASSSSSRHAPLGQQLSQAAPKPAGDWQRETSWSVLAELDNEVVRRRVVLRKRVGVNHGFHNSIYDAEASSPFLEQGKRPPDAGFAEGLDNSCSFRLSTSSGDVNAEHYTVPWDKDFSSATSEDPESLFTSFEVDSTCVTPRATSSSSLPGFQTSKPRFAVPKGSEGRSGGEPSSAWTPPFIPEECETACLSPEDSDPEPAEEGESQLSDTSEQASDIAEFDSEEEEDGSLSSFNYDGIRQADCDLSQNDEELEARPSSFLPNDDFEAPSMLLEACWELPQCRETAEQARGVSEPWPDFYRMECSSSNISTEQEEEDDTEHKAAVLGWTDGLQSLLEGRLFPSSEDEVAVRNEPDSNCNEGGRLVVSDESSDERDGQYSGATTERREAPYLRRKAPRCKRNHVAGGTMRIPRETKGLDRKPAVKSGDSSMKKRNSHSTREEHMHAAPAVGLPAEIRGRVRESVPVVTHSYDPYTDFRDSMVEMILEKDILDTQDLEELLHAYLALNKGEFHGLIVEVFTDLWYQIFEAESSRL